MPGLAGNDVLDSGDAPNEPECQTNWYGCNTNQCSQYACDTIEGSDCW
jgi:hypothetical protein